MKLWIVCIGMGLCLVGCSCHNSLVDDTNNPFSSPLTNNGDGNIINGTPVKERKTEAARSVVIVEQVKKGGFRGATCTGSLVGPHTVLTAAHCIDKSHTGDFIGVNVIFVDHSGNPQAPRHVRHAIGYEKHPRYNTHSRVPPLQYDHDIAIVVFEGEIPHGFNFVPMDTNSGQDYSYDTVYVYGYGRGRDLTGDSKRDKFEGLILRKGVMQVNGRYSGYPDRYYTSPTSQSRVCYGDSGGPQFYHEGGVLKQIGVNSGVIGKKLPNGRQDCSGPAQVTKVAPFYSWIKQQERKILN